jgi:hypothetical protein
LGTFTFAFAFDDGGWTATVAAPAFDAFVYDSGMGPDRRPTGRYTLAFEAENETDLPSAEAIAVAAAVLTNAAALVPVVTRGLWDDFTGVGPYSGMWWHGDLESVAEEMPPLEAPDDLRLVLRITGVHVRKPNYVRDREMVELRFDAAFEQEHGIGVLTDGQRVLGNGYAYDVSPFKS